MPDLLEEKVLKLLSAHPYTIYFSDELMEYLQVTFQQLLQTIIAMASKNLIYYKDATTKDGADFTVKFIIPVKA